MLDMLPGQLVLCNRWVHCLRRGSLRDDGNRMHHMSRSCLSLGLNRCMLYRLAIPLQRLRLLLATGPGV